MPVPKGRDPDRTRAGLGQWFATVRPAAVDVDIALLPSPRATGYSSETVLFEARWTEDGEERRAAYAARIRPSGYTLFRTHDLDTQWRVIDALGRHSDVPVPPFVGYADEGTSPLGQPFFVTERVEGLVPPDWPSYIRSGWVVESTPAQQYALYQSGLEVLAAVRAADWRRIGLEFMGRADQRPVGIESQTEQDRQFLAWVAEGRRLPLFEQAIDWLGAHGPADDRLSLNWGDARLGNIIFADFKAAAVLDWEMTSVGPPEADLGWFLCFHRIHTYGHGNPDLPGAPSVEEIVALYEKLTGAPVRHLHFFEVRAALRASMLLFRFNDMLLANNKITPDSPDGPHLPATRVLEYLLADPDGRSVGG